MTPEEFEPQFREDIYINNQDGSRTQVNPKYCATYDCAEDLRQMFQQYGPVIQQDWPLTSQWGGGFTASEKVPYLVFPAYTDADPNHTVRENAGQLADCWCHGLTPDVAYRNACSNIENLLRGN